MMLSHKASSAVLPHWPTRYLTTMHQDELFINKKYRGKQSSLPHCETLKHQRRLLYNSRESTAKNMEPGQRYEILKIWVPNHGAVNVYRSPGGGTQTVLEVYSMHHTEDNCNYVVSFFLFFQNTMWITAAFLENLGMSMVSRRYEFWLLMEVLS